MGFKTLHKSEGHNPHGNQNVMYRWKKVGSLFCVDDDIKGADALWISRGRYCCFALARRGNWFTLYKRPENGYCETAVLEVHFHDFDSQALQWATARAMDYKPTCPQCHTGTVVRHKHYRCENCGWNPRRKVRVEE